MVVLMFVIFVLSILGYFVEHRSLGNKTHPKAMVEAYEEETPSKISVEAQKTRWALIIYCFSITKSFN